MGTNLAALSLRIGASATELGGKAFFVKGCGSICAAAASAKVFAWFDGDAVLVCCLAGIAALMAALPHVSHPLLLYLYFFSLGFLAAMNDAGCNILTRRKRGKGAGPWLAGNGVAFGVSAALVPLVGLVTPSLDMQFCVIGSLVLGVALLVAHASLLSAGALDRHAVYLGDDDADLNEKELEECDREARRVQKLMLEQIAPHYYVEMAIGAMVLCICGIQVTTCSYLATYLALSASVPTALQHVCPLLFWVCWTAGRACGVLDQRRALTDAQLRHHLTALLFLAALASLLLLCCPASPPLVALAIALFALFHGPTNGYCLDLNNRLTLPTEKSTSIVMVCVNGGDFFPFCAALLWKANRNRPVTFVLFMLGCTVVPFALSQFVESLSYKSELPDFEEKHSAIEEATATASFCEGMKTRSYSASLMYASLVGAPSHIRDRRSTLSDLGKLRGVCTDEALCSLR